MTTDRDIHKPPELAADAAVDAPRPDPQPDDTTATAGASQPHDEATMRAWEGLPPDTMILAPAFVPPPMRYPDEVWATLVTAVDIIGDADPDRAGEVALFAGNWVADEPPGRQLERSAGRAPPSAITPVRVTSPSSSQRLRILGAVDLPIPATVDRAVAVLPGLFRSACHSFSSVSVRGFAGSVAGFGTARGGAVGGHDTSQW